MVQNPSPRNVSLRQPDQTHRPAIYNVTLHMLFCWLCAPPSFWSLVFILGSSYVAFTDNARSRGFSAYAFDRSQTVHGSTCSTQYAYGGSIYPIIKKGCPPKPLASNGCGKRQRYGCPGDLSHLLLVQTENINDTLEQLSRYNV